MRTVTGEVVFPEHVSVSAGLVAEIEVLDISEADAPSRMIAKQTVQDPVVTAHGRLEFSLDVPETDPAGQLTLRAHVHPVDAVGMAPGDLLSTVMIPVPPTGTPEPVETPVVQI